MTTLTFLNKKARNKTIKKRVAEKLYKTFLYYLIVKICYKQMRVLDMPKKTGRVVRLRKGHKQLNPRLRGKEETLIMRAFRMGVTNVSQLAKVTGLPKHKVKELLDKAKFMARAMGKPLPRSAVERMLINGELSISEIAKIAHTTPHAVSRARAHLKERGVLTLIPGSILPPMVVARTILRYEVLRQISGKSKTWCGIAAGVETTGDKIHSWERRVPNIFKDVKTISDGVYWEKAQEQLKGWIKEQERIYGKKYDPKKGVK